MSNADHVDLLEVLNEYSGPVILSGYEHPLYNKKLSHWKKETRREKLMVE